MSANFATLRQARNHCRRKDLDGVFIVEGKGTPFAPWAVLDAGVAEDLISDDLGRDRAKALLGDLDRAGKWVVFMADYTEASA